MKTFRNKSKFNKPKHYRAFSLIELSIAIIIVGILIAGVMQGLTTLQKAQLKTAQNLTRNSAVNGIKNLVSWYETSLESSFKVSEAVDGSTVSIWYDNNPQTTTKNNITQSNAANKPNFYENVFNFGIPSVRFDGVQDGVNGDYLSFDSTNLMSTNFTIFVVEKRGGDKSTYDMFLSGSGDSAVSGTNILLGYLNGDIINFVFSGNLVRDSAINFDNSAKQQQPTMHTFWFSQTSGKKYWMNGGKNADSSTTTQLTPLSSNPNSSVGGYKTQHPYAGDLAEFIVFNRDLTTEERRAVESYLSQKYNIKISD